MDEHLKQESFYTSAPFSYSPSVAEYLTTLKISENGFIADIMHMDKKRKLNITQYLSDGFEIELINDTDIKGNERFIWNYLKSHSIENKAKITHNEIKKIIKTYENEVLKRMDIQFLQKIPFNPKRTVIGYIIFGVLVSIFFGIITSFVSMPFMAIYFILTLMSTDPFVKMLITLVYYLVIISIPLGVLLFLGLKKLSRSPIEKKYIFKEVIWKFLKLQIFTYGLILLLSLSALVGTMFLQIAGFVILVYIGAYVIYYYYFGKIAYTYLAWLNEDGATEQNRQEWLKFKDFVIKNSEVEKKPYKYYELWEEFYYYTLAVGAIKNPTKQA